MKTSGRNFVRGRRDLFQRTVVAFTCRLRNPRKTRQDGRKWGTDSKLVLPTVNVNRYTTTLSTNMGRGQGRETLKANELCMRKCHVKRPRGWWRWELREQDWKYLNGIQLTWDSVHWRNFCWGRAKSTGSFTIRNFSVWYRWWAKMLAVSSETFVN